MGDANYDESLKLAEQYKTEGNKFLQENSFALAIAKYTQAIELKIETPKNAIYYSNRAFVNTKIENLQEWRQDICNDIAYFENMARLTNELIEIKDNNIKWINRELKKYTLLSKQDNEYIEMVEGLIKDRNSCYRMRSNLRKQLQHELDNIDLLKEDFIKVDTKIKELARGCE